MFKNLKLILKGLIQLSNDPSFLFKLLKELSNQAPLYVLRMDRTPEPDSYVVIDEPYDEGYSSGDGQDLLRTNTFNIRIHSVNIEKALELGVIYRTLLNNNKLKHKKIGPTYDPSTGYYSILLTGNRVYGV